MGIDVDVTIDNSEFELLKKNLDRAESVVAFAIGRALSFVAIDLLARAQPRVPIDSGELRQSGRARLYISGNPLVVGYGRADGSIQADTTKITKSRFMRGLPTNRNLRSEVSYERYNQGFDVAIFTHEYIKDYTGEVGNKAQGLYFARTPGTGPKYLERPFLEQRDNYHKIIAKVAREGVIKGIKEISSTIRVRRGKYTVNLIKLRR